MYVVRRSNLTFGVSHPGPKAGSSTDSLGVIAMQRGRALMRVSPALVRVFALAALLAYLGFTVSAVRYDDPILRETTRSRSAEVVNSTTRFQKVAVESATRPALGSGGTSTPQVVVAYEPPRQRFPRCLFCRAPKAQAPPGADALGVSVPRRLRWAVLGGHGRHGAG